MFRPSQSIVPNVVKLPGSAAFFISAYKIYAVYPSKRYKSNILFGRPTSIHDMAG
jgi:hypothetical protein